MSHAVFQHRQRSIIRQVDLQGEVGALDVAAAIHGKLNRHGGNGEVEVPDRDAEMHRPPEIVVLDFFLAAWNA